jgi:phosphoserine phosphatase RsbU/P
MRYVRKEEPAKDYPMHILIAEDDLTSRTVLTALLQKQGHQVLATEDGGQAWEKMQLADRPSMAILDWMMPVMDGPELCRRIRTLSADLPPYIILLTTRSEKRDIVAGLQAGADDYITKPYDPGELEARVGVGQRMLALQSALHDKMAALQQALDEVRTLRGILPICANCKKVRDDQGYWNQVEEYVRRITGAQFSHGICPDCALKLYPEYDLYKK